MEKNQLRPSGRIVYLDMMRIIAMMAAIMVHITAPFLQYATEASGSFLCANILNSVSRIPVPVFLMISGALMLDENREVTFRKTLSRAIKILGILYFWSLFYAAYTHILGPVLSHQPVSIKRFLQSFLVGHYHLWYLFLLFSLTLLTPVLKKFVKKENIKAVQWLILLAVIFKFCIPVPNMLLNHYINLGTEDVLLKYSELFHLGMVNEYLIYYLLGWLLTNLELSPKKRYILYGLGTAGILFTVFGIQLWTFEIEDALPTFYNHGTLHMFLYTAAVFVFLQQAFLHTESRSWIRELARISMGIYLIHPLFAGIFYRVIRFPDTLGLILLRWALTAVVSAIVSMILCRIPVLNKTIRM